MIYTREGRGQAKLTARIIRADGTIVELGELKRTWRSWPIIKPALALFRRIIRRR